MGGRLDGHLVQGHVDDIAKCVDVKLNEGSWIFTFSFNEKFKNRLFDVGIAEQHAVTMAAGMATEGYKPLVPIYSTVLQSAYDQIVHDVALQKLPVRFAIDRAGQVGADGPTHAGSFDITYLSTLPNFIVMAASDEAELVRMINTSVDINDRPSAFRYPRGNGVGVELPSISEKLEIGKGRVIKEGKNIAVINFGTRLSECLMASENLSKKGINITALGGFTSIIFENFNLLQHKQIRNTSLDWERFTTGNTHTAWIICRQLEMNAPKIGIDLQSATVAVVGATGDIGSAVCRWLINKTGIGELLMVARQQEPLASLQKELDGGTIKNLDEALPEADIVVWVASMPKTMEIDTNNLKKPCLMIDGGYPKNLDEKFQGNDIHVLKGGIVKFFNDIGWNMMELAEMQNPQREMFACFAEAMILEFEKCHTNFSWGRNNISLEKMEFIGAASMKHGFSAIGLDKQPKVLAV